MGHKAFHVTMIKVLAMEGRDDNLAGKNAFKLSCLIHLV